MADVGTALRDGYSTTGTAGTGLGAMMRLSAVFDVYSSPRSGTAVFIQLGAGASRTSRLAVGGVVVAKPGQDVSGDAWAAEFDHGCHRILLADGLGYGVRAAEAAREAIRVFRQSASFRPGQALHAIHAALRATRGAAVAIAELDSARDVLTFAGVGNVAGVIYSEDGSRNLVSHNGTAGLEARKIQEFTYPWGPGCLLIMHSDGLKTHWSLDNYPGLALRHPSLIAGVLYRDFTRGPDDVSVVVARHAA
jgi:Stage II sporulation protein E (SpoIIE)